MRAVQALQGARSLVQVLRIPALQQPGGRRSFTVQPDNILYSDYEGSSSMYCYVVQPFVMIQNRFLISVDAILVYKDVQSDT